ncbi:hypothetical protein ACQKWADRAFT_283504 [Trichoderma austrokoningii]
MMLQQYINANRLSQSSIDIQTFSVTTSSQFVYGKDHCEVDSHFTRLRFARKPSSALDMHEILIRRPRQKLQTEKLKNWSDQ